jgi:hypothetical protein
MHWFLGIRLVTLRSVYRKILNNRPADATLDPVFLASTGGYNSSVVISFYLKLLPTLERHFISFG